MTRYNIKMQELNSRSAQGTSITIDAQSEIEARIAAKGIAQARWPNRSIIVCEVRKQ